MDCVWQVMIYQLPSAYVVLKNKSENQHQLEAALTADAHASLRA